MFDVYRLVLQLPLLKLLMHCSNYIWVINNFIARLGASYIRGFTGYGLFTHIHHGHFTGTWDNDVFPSASENHVGYR